MINIKSLKKSFDDLIIFQNFNIDFEDNIITGLLGPSGCGKTTLLNIISGLIDYDEGDIKGVDRNSISYIFQEPRLLEWMTVFENIEFVLKDKYLKSEYTDIINKYLKLVELYEFKDYYPEKLSGGMKQRASIARAFANPSKLLLMDEPFKGLDINLKYNLINAFIKLWEEDKKTIISVTHDIDEILRIADKVYILGDRPLKILNEISINIPRDNRQRENKEMNKYYNLLGEEFN